MRPVDHTHLAIRSSFQNEKPVKAGIYPFPRLSQLSRIWLCSYLSPVISASALPLSVYSDTLTGSTRYVYWLPLTGQITQGLTLVLNRMARSGVSMFLITSIR